MVHKIMRRALSMLKCERCSVLLLMHPVLGNSLAEDRAQVGNPFSLKYSPWSRIIIISLCSMLQPYCLLAGAKHRSQVTWVLFRLTGVLFSLTDCEWPVTCDLWPLFCTCPITYCDKLIWSEVQDCRKLIQYFIKEGHETNVFYSYMRCKLA